MRGKYLSDRTVRKGHARLIGNQKKPDVESLLKEPKRTEFLRGNEAARTPIKVISCHQKTYVKSEKEKRFAKRLETYIPQFELSGSSNSENSS